MRQHFDVVIVGAGPAGAVLAAELDRRFQILLVDKRCFTDPSRLYDLEKSCGGLLDKRAQKALAARQIPLPGQVLVSPQVFTLKGVDLDNSMNRYYQKQYVNIDRVKFDAYMVERAIRRDNVTLWEDTTVTGFEETTEGVAVQVRRGGREQEVEADILIGADGGGSLVRRHLQKKKKRGVEPKRYASLQEWHPMPEEMPCFTAVFDRRVTDFYSWIIPENGQIIIGSALPGEGDVQQRFDIFKEDLIKLGFDLSRPIKKRGAIICRPKPLGSIHSGAGRVYLVGEAAGLISPCSCEGISFAMNSAFGLARTLNEGKGRKKYEKRLRPLKLSIFVKSFKSPIMYGKFLRGLVFRTTLLSMKVYED